MYIWLLVTTSKEESESTRVQPHNREPTTRLIWNFRRMPHTRRHNSKDLIPHISSLPKLDGKTFAVSLSVRDKQVEPVLPLSPYGPSLTDVASSAHSISHYPRMLSINETFDVVTRCK